MVEVESWSNPYIPPKPTLLIDILPSNAIHYSILITTANGCKPMMVHAGIGDKEYAESELRKYIKMWEEAYPTTTKAKTKEEL